MKKYIFLAIVLFPTFGLAQFSDFEQFPDWSETAIESVKEAGIMTGYADATFRPNVVINRAEALTILFRTKNMDIGDIEYVPNFSDVPSDAWFADAVNLAVAEGWITGHGDGTFRPEDPINNAEWATLLQRAFDIEPDTENVPNFSDVPAKIWFDDAVGAIYANGLIRTSRAKFFYPAEGVTRASAAWTIATVLRMPRLLGTSQTNDFTGVKIDSRRVAYPRGSDFNPNLQGYDVARSALNIETNADTNTILVTKSSDWQSVGQLRLTNSLTDPVSLQSLEFKLRFDATNVGPDRNFLLRIVGPEIDTELHLDRTGSVLFSGLKNTIKAGDTLVLHMQLKPDAEQSFYMQVGEGVISIETAVGSTRAKDDEGRTIFKTTPIEFISRKFTAIQFQP
jgi:hypothetical protein